MLVADAELARCPRFADLVHDRRQDLEVETLGFHPAGKQVLDLAPGRRFVASGHRRDQRVPPSAHLGVSLGGGAGWCSRGSLGVEECVEADRVDHPLAALSFGVQPTGAHIAVRGHVVDAEAFGRFGQRDRWVSLPLWVLLPSVRRRSSRRRGTRVAVQRLGACRPQISTNPMIFFGLLGTTPRRSPFTKLVLNSEHRGKRVVVVVSPAIAVPPNRSSSHAHPAPRGWVSASCRGRSGLRRVPDRPHATPRQPGG